MRLWNRFFAPGSENRTAWNIIGWWEIRRLFFNFIQIALIAIVFHFLGLRFWTTEMGSGEYFVLLLFIAHLLIANLIYTLGWIIEVLKPVNPAFAKRFFLTVLSLSVFILIAISGSLAFLLSH